MALHPKFSNPSRGNTPHQTPTRRIFESVEDTLVAILKPHIATRPKYANDDDLEMLMAIVNRHTASDPNTNWTFYRALIRVLELYSEFVDDGETWRVARLLRPNIDVGRIWGEPYDPGADWMNQLVSRRGSRRAS